MQISDDQNTITYNSDRLEFVEYHNRDCGECYFKGFGIIKCYELPCQAHERKDNKRGIFKEVKP